MTSRPSIEWTTESRVEIRITIKSKIKIETNLILGAAIILLATPGSLAGAAAARPHASTAATMNHARPHLDTATPRRVALPFFVWGGGVGGGGGWGAPPCREAAADLVCHRVCAPPYEPRCARRRTIIPPLPFRRGEGRGEGTVLGFRGAKHVNFCRAGGS